ncbi:MAG: M28 family peptidase [Solirubrobacteraceae bacterium]
MLDLRVYRAAFVPALLAIIVVAFALEGRQAPIAGTPLAPDAFDGRRAIAELEALEAAFPDRRPGAPDDERLATRVAATLGQGREFDVSTRRFKAQTAEGERTLTTVVAVRQGLDPRRIVVMAHRDALEPGSAAELSGTAALLELGRVFRVGRSLRRTLVLVSTSGGTAGLAGARDFAEKPGGEIEAAIVLGDVAGEQTRRPLVVPWSNALGAAPAALDDTLRGALRAEVGLRPGGYRLPGRVARLAFPLTLTEQGALNERGAPAVLISATGERGPVGERAVSRKRLQSFGRASLRTVTAVDGVRGDLTEPDADLGIQRKVIPSWSVRLVTGLLILPALLAAVDGFARARRRRHPVGMWLRWALAGAAPFLLAAALVWALRLVGLIAAPGAPAPAGAVPLDSAALAAMGSATLAFILGWIGLRPMLLRALGVSGKPESPGAAAAVILLLVAVVVLIWVRNPYAAALLLPALHGWLLAVEPRTRGPRLVLALVALLALLPVALVGLYYMRAFGMSAGELAWMLLLLVAGGGIGLGGLLAWSLLGGCLLSVLAILRRKPRRERPEPAASRGPLSYAGPGSLGGSESALRR